MWKVDGCCGGVFLLWCQELWLCLSVCISPSVFLCLYAPLIVTSKLPHRFQTSKNRMPLFNNTENVTYQLLRADFVLNSIQLSIDSNKYIKMSLRFQTCYDIMVDFSNWNNGYSIEYYNFEILKYWMARVNDIIRFERIDCSIPIATTNFEINWKP